MIMPIMHYDNATASADCSKANLFNIFFESIYTKLSSDFPLAAVVPDTTLCDIEISDSEVYLALRCLDTSKAMGPDGINPTVLKQCADGLYRPIHKLFTLCLSCSCIPSEWKTHCIIPIFKSGDRSSIKNYRPISLLCCISKVLERLIYDRIMEFVSESLSLSHFGFLRNHSCLQQLLIFVNDIHASFENQTQRDAIYLDFRKAFDSVPHAELLLKLQTIGISGNLLKWLQGYLSSRQQYVSLNKHVSETLPVSSGVPQGSILGPLLFIIFVNDLPQVSKHSDILLFADDTKCSTEIDCMQSCVHFQDDINALTDWGVKWRLLFNETKSAVLQFTKKKHPTQTTYYIHESPVPTQESYKDLGVTLTTSLSWNSHYDRISAKAYKHLGLLRRTFKDYSFVQTKKCLYLSLVRSQITYCSPLWRPYLIKDILSLERIQRRATKYILNDYVSDYKSRLVSLELLPLMMWYELMDIMFFVKSYKQPTPRFDILKFFTISPSTSTRSSSRLTLRHTFSRTNSSRHFYFKRFPRLWNVLPPLDLSLSVEAIRSQVKKHLWCHFISHFIPDNPCTFHLVCPCSKCQ